MARCSICSSPHRDAVDRALIDGQMSMREIAARWGFSRAAVQRHHANHLPAALVRAKDIKEEIRADGLLGQVKSLRDRADAILKRAETSGDAGTALRAIRELRGVLDLYGKVAGEITEGPTINVLLTPEWERIAATLLRALQPFPDARAVAATALLELEASPNARP